MDDPGYIPKRLYGYLTAVAIAGPAVAIAAALRAGIDFAALDLLPAALLLVLATIAERYPVHLSHKTAINTATAAYLAMIVIFPVWIPGLVALAAIIAGQLLRRSDPVEAAFNIGQGTLYVVAGAFTYWFAGSAPVGEQPWSDAFIPAVLAAASMHIVNSLLVSGAGAIQMGLNPLRVWVGNLAYDDLAGHAALTALGFVAALMVRDYPLALLVLALPVALVQHSTGQLVKLREDTHSALATLVKLVELRDPYTAGHSDRVAATARELALRMGLTAEQADVIESAGYVHDIGKVAIDPAILTKPGRLTEDEWEQMKLHPEHSAQVISQFDAYIPCHAMVRHHHESWDGAGYPDGLAGEAIPLGARILAVADTYDALTSDRPYRLGMTGERALAILREGAGTQWDPKVVSAMLAFLAEESPQEVPSRVEEHEIRLPLPA